MAQVSSSTDVTRGNVYPLEMCNFGIKGRELTAGCCDFLLLQKVTVQFGLAQNSCQGRIVTISE